MVYLHFTPSRQSGKGHLVLYLVMRNQQVMPVLATALARVDGRMQTPCRCCVRFGQHCRIRHFIVRAR